MTTLGAIHYAGKLQSLEQTIRLWNALKGSIGENPQFYLAALQAVISCKKQSFDAKQLHLRLQNARERSQIRSCMKETTELLDTLASRIEYGWQDWDE